MTKDQILLLGVQSDPAIIYATDEGEHYIIRAGQNGSTARRVLVLDNDGDLVTGPDGGATLGTGGNLDLPRFRYLGFLDETGTRQAGMYFWPGHSGGDEMVCTSPRWAWYWNDGMQFGSPATLRDNRYIYIQPNQATASDTTVESPPLAFCSRYWDGAANQTQRVWLYTEPTSAAANSERFVVNFGGANPVADHRIDDGTEMISLDREGLTVGGSIGGTELSADPADPAEGKHVMWQSDGTGSGDDGDIMVKITAGGVTKTTTLVDFSAIA